MAEMKLPADFETYPEARKAGFMNMKRLVTEKLDKAYLNIETDYSQSDKGQINTRLAAFLETIDK